VVLMLLINVCMMSVWYVNKSSAVVEMGDCLATIDMGHGLKIGGVPLSLFSGGARSPSKTMSPGTRPTFLPSGTLIHPVVWPQYTNVTDRQDRQRSDQHRANRFANGRPIKR